MPKSIISEGKTTAEAISNGLKELNVSKDMVDIKILEEHEKRSFFSILAPRVVKVELTLKEDKKENKPIIKSATKNIDFNVDEKELEKIRLKLENFLSEFINNVDGLNYDTSIDLDKNFVVVNINGENSKILIGYRGEVLNSFQVILNSIANKNSKYKVKVILNVSNYKQKREKSLEELADKISKTVLKTGKSITLEPMMAYERKIIHNRLQGNNKITTYSVGDEPHRRVVVSKK